MKTAPINSDALKDLYPRALSGHGSFPATMLCGGHLRVKSPFAKEISGCALRCAGAHPCSRLGAHPLSVLLPKLTEARLV